MFARIFVDFS